MPEPRRETLLLQMDHAWGHPWESLQSALKGVTEDMATWQSPAYRDEPKEPGRPLPGSIARHVQHLAACKAEYRLMILERPAKDPEGGSIPSGTFPDLLAALTSAHEVLRAAVSALADADLQDPVGNGQPLSEYITMTIRHDTWHASQIALARRLWKTRMEGN